MLARQTAFYFAANAFSALFGLFNVVAFTRFFTAEAYGDYLLGFAFATFFAIFLSSAIRLAVLREQARGDGTDVRPAALAALMLSAFALPLGYFAARLTNLSPTVACASMALTATLIVYDTCQELLRAEQKAGSYFRGTAVRATLVSGIGVAFALFGRTGALLLASTAIAYLLSALTIWRTAWGTSAPRFDARRLAGIVSNGFPVAISLALLALSGITDRFLLGDLIGVGAAGQFGAGLDIVRQSLVIPAMSIAGAFVPMTVRLLATRGAPETRRHLEKYLVMLLAATLPACVGLAIVAPHVADLMLGPRFRELAHDSMPIFSAALLFQILTQQYLHTSFLLSNRTSFYLVNTGSIIVWNLVGSYLLISRFGVMGAVWGRLATEIFGFANALVLSRIAFAMPFPLRIVLRIVGAAALMGLSALVLERATESLGATALLIVVPAGAAIYVAAAWVLDIGGLRAFSGMFIGRLLGSRAALAGANAAAARKLATTKR
jgi:O-antigen/teichoic acid export membrane protein